MKRVLFVVVLLCSGVMANTVPNVPYTITYTCTGSAGPFAFTFPVYDATGFVVTINGSTQSPTAYHSTPVNNNYTNGGSVTLNSACTNGNSLTITRVTPITQTIKYYDGMPVPMTTFERSLDKLTEISQEIWGGTTHSIQFQSNGANVGSPSVGDMVLNFDSCSVGGPAAGNKWTVNCAGSGGSSVDLSSPPPIGDIAPNDINWTMGAGKSTNGVLNPTQFAGADLGAQINSALASVASSATILIPSNPSGYNMSTAVANTKDGITFECADSGSPITWTPLTGTAFSTTGTQRVAFRNCTVTTGASSTATALKIGAGAENTLVEGWSSGIENSSAQFAVGIDIGGTDTNPTGNTRIVNSHFRNFTTTGTYVHHAIDTYLTNNDNYAVPANPTHAWGTTIDTGASGVYLSQTTSGGSSGMIVKNSTPTANAYGKPPQYIVGAIGVQGDVCYNSACILFDSSLATPGGPSGNFYGYDYELSGWASGCQLSGCSGVVVQGGIGINIHDMVIRGNQCHGVLLDYTADDHHGPVAFHDNILNGNSLETTGTCDDYHITAGTSDFQIKGGFAYGSGLGDSFGNVARYGVYIETGASDNFTISHLGTKGLTAGAIFDGSTGVHKTIEDVYNPNIANITFRNNLSVGDANNYIALAANNPTWNTETNSSLYYDRTAHQWNFSFSGAKVSINSSQMVLASGVTLATTNAPNFGQGIQISGNTFTDSSRNTTVNNLTILGTCIGACGSSLPDQTGHGGQFLGTDGTSASWTTPPGGGNVTGPGTSTTNAIALFADTSGTLLKNSSVSGTTFNGANNLVQMTAAGKLPAVDASLLTSVNATNVNGGAVPTSATVLGSNSSGQPVNNTSSVALPDVTQTANAMVVGNGTNHQKIDSNVTTDGSGHITAAGFIGIGSGAGYSNWGAGNDNGVPGTGYMGVQAPTSITTPYRITWPSAPPSGTQAFSCTDGGTHNLSCAWTSAGTGNVNTNTTNTYTGGTSNLNDFSAVAIKAPVGANAAQNFYGGADIAIIHAKGGVTTVASAANTDVSRGLALNSVCGPSGSIVEGDDVWLNPQTSTTSFDLGNSNTQYCDITQNGTLTATHLHLNGATIKRQYPGSQTNHAAIGVGGAVEIAGPGTITCNNASNGASCTAISNGNGTTGNTLSGANLHDFTVNGQFDCLLFSLESSTTNTLYTSNVTCNSYFDSFTAGPDGGATNATLTWYMRNLQIFPTTESVNKNISCWKSAFSGTGNSATYYLDGMQSCKLTDSIGGALVNGLLLGENTTVYTNPSLTIDSSGVTTTGRKDISLTAASATLYLADGAQWNTAKLTNSGTITPWHNVFGTATIPISSTGLATNSLGGFVQQTAANVVSEFNSGTCSGYLKSDGTCDTPSVGSVAFNTITGGTNTSAAMVVGAGASLATTSTGTIEATSYKGYTPASGKVLGGATPSAVTITSAYVDNTIALTGTDINTSNQVTATHLASPLSTTQGGTGQNFSASTGIVQLSSGTASASTALANGTTATTQTSWDGTTKAATDAYAESLVKPIFSTAQTGVNIPATALTVAGSSASMVTPASDGTYEFDIEIIQTSPGVGTCLTGALAVSFSYENPDSSVTYALGTSPMILLHSMSGGGASNATGIFNTGANSSGNDYVSVPFQFRAKAGVPIQYQVFTPSGSGSNCSTSVPVVTIRPALYYKGF